MLCDWLSLHCLGLGINHLLPMSGPFLGKIINKLVCPFERMENSFCLLYENIYIDITCSYVLPPKYFSLLIFISISHIAFNTLRPRQNGRHFADDTFKRIFFNENV